MHTFVDLFINIDCICNMYRYFHLQVSLFEMNIEGHAAKERMRKL